MDTKPDDPWVTHLLQTLDRHVEWSGRPLVKYGGFWFPVYCFPGVLSAQRHFKAEPNDLILASFPKSGTTWLKALTFSIATRKLHPPHQSPLLTTNPHALVHFLELDLYMGHNPHPNLNHISPRIFSTHLAHQILPGSIHESGCKIIYICRNPLDQFVSHRQFLLDNPLDKKTSPLGIEAAIDMFVEGKHLFGPMWDHMLGYMEAHRENPKRVMFLKYEELKKDLGFHVRRIGEFMGCPFTAEEERLGVVEEIERLCSLENLKSLEVNKSGEMVGKFKNSSFFRKGDVGGWRDYLTPDAAQRVKEAMESKLEGSGLTFDI